LTNSSVLGCASNNFAFNLKINLILRDVDHNKKGWNISGPSYYTSPE
jgi:hypothetical protein